MSRATALAVVRNLKLLNAKERDHLMRFAYLGQADEYARTTTFLSEECNAQLSVHALQMGLAPPVRCVFAGMDYHLDWLFAALWLGRTAPDWTPGQGPAPRVPMAPHEPEAGTKSLYTDFRPVSGSQEDVDLIAVYDDGTRMALLLLEAKGAASFDKVQLARKLIRLDRILVESGVAGGDDPSLLFRLVLASPKRPAFDDCLSFARSLPLADSGQDKFKAMRLALDSHPSGIGQGLHFLQIAGFPQEAHAVERVPTMGSYTHWALRKRK